MSRTARRTRPRDPGLVAELATMAYVTHLDDGALACARVSALARTARYRVRAATANRPHPSCHWSCRLIRKRRPTRVHGSQSRLTLPICPCPYSFLWICASPYPSWAYHLDPSFAAQRSQTCISHYVTDSDHLREREHSSSLPACTAPSHLFLLLCCLPCGDQFQCLRP